MSTHARRVDGSNDQAARQHELLVTLPLPFGYTSGQIAEGTRMLPEVAVSGSDRPVIEQFGLPDNMVIRLAELGELPAHHVRLDALLLVWRDSMMGPLHAAVDQASHMWLPLIVLCPRFLQETAVELGADYSLPLTASVRTCRTRALSFARRRGAAEERWLLTSEREAMPATYPLRLGQASEVQICHEQPEADPPDVYLCDVHESDVQTAGSVRLIKSGRSVSINGRLVPLAPKEFDVLWLLVMHSNESVSPKKLVEHVWGIGFDTGTNRLAFTVYQLRARLREHDLPMSVQTIRGVGYQLVMMPGPVGEVDCPPLTSVIRTPIQSWSSDPATHNLGR